jgi:hypothetical protein
VGGSGADNRCAGSDPGGVAAVGCAGDTDESVEGGNMMKWWPFKENKRYMTEEDLCSIKKQLEDKGIDIALGNGVLKLADKIASRVAESANAGIESVEIGIDVELVKRLCLHHPIFNGLKFKEIPGSYYDWPACGGGSYLITAYCQSRGKEYGLASRIKIHEDEQGCLSILYL